MVSVMSANPAPGVANDDIVTNEARVRTAVEASGAAGVVVMRPVAKDQTVTSTPSMYTGPMYGPYWGGYYGYGSSYSGSSRVWCVDEDGDPVPNATVQIY
jgi:hypothetical protein